MIPFKFVHECRGLRPESPRLDSRGDPKFVQIAEDATPEGFLYALDSDGCVWYFEQVPNRLDGQWVPLVAKRLRAK